MDGNQNLSSIAVMRYLIQLVRNIHIHFIDICEKLHTYISCHDYAIDAYLSYFESFFNFSLSIIDIINYLYEK